MAINRKFVSDYLSDELSEIEVPLLTLILGRNCLRIAPLIAQSTRRDRSRLSSIQLLCNQVGLLISTMPIYVRDNGTYRRFPANYDQFRDFLSDNISQVRNKNVLNSILTAATFSIDPHRSLALESITQSLKAAARYSMRADETLFRAIREDIRIAKSSDRYKFSEVPIWPLGRIPSWILDACEYLSVYSQAVDSNSNIWSSWYEYLLFGKVIDFDELDLRFGMQPYWLTRGPQAFNSELKRRLVDAGKWSDELGDGAGVQPPQQRPAPVVVEDRGGKVAPISNRQSKLNAAERDFEAWRVPISRHISELLLSDFKQGTNHSRARDRLIALDNLLPGTIPDVLERQFMIGYEIDRLEGLLAAYRANGEDMPSLPIDVFQDLDRLHLGLKLGVSKLDRWAEFKRDSEDDPTHVGSANKEQVADALVVMASEMESKLAYFDPEIPKTFRFLAEAVRDPRGATKTVVFGAVRSGENVLGFLAMKALGIGMNAIKGVEEGISKAVSAGLFVGLSAAAIKLSGALPQNLEWLKPVLESISKSLRSN